MAPLLFIPFLNGNRRFLGLVDSGAELNVIDSMLLRDTEYSVATEHPGFSTLRGVQGKSSRIVRWTDLLLQLPNSQSEIVRFATIKGLPNGIILGRPFLRQIGAIVDHKNGILTTRQGPICLTGAEERHDAGLALLHVVPGLTIEAEMLNKEQLARLKDIMENHAGLWENSRKGIASGITHKIVLSNNAPINSRPRRYPADQQQAIAREITRMLNENIIRPSCSPYASEIVLVKKGSGDWRVCIDYRQLNASTILDRFPVPHVSDLLRRVQHSRYFVALDLRAGYWQIPMDPASIQYTAFRCFKGLFEFLVMPFGLCNAPATFQRLMNSLFGDRYFNGIVVYLDDILIHGETIDATLDLLQEALTRLDNAGLSINLEKCKFFPQRLKYLGHIIEDGRLFPNPDRVAVLRQLKWPETIHDVRSVIGLLGYYQQYVKGYSEILGCVFDLLKVGKNTKRFNRQTKICWTQEHTNAIACAMEILGRTSLSIPLECDEFLLETDASGQAVGAILSCKTKEGVWSPVEFASKKLSETQQHWPTREKEAFAIIFGLQKFEHFLRGRKFVVHTDHESLKWMLEARNSKIARWASRMAEFDMTIFYKRGHEMSHVDFLSRYVDADQDDDLQERMVYTVEVPGNSGCQTKGKKHCDAPLPTIADIVNAQKEGSLPHGKGYFCRENCWYFRSGLWVPTALRIQVMASCHAVSPSCHVGTKKTKRLIQKVFNWPNLHDDVSRYIKGCLICQRTRPGLDRIQGFFRMHPLPGPFQTVYMDYWSCDFNGHQTVLTMIDQFTKWAECTPVADRMDTTITSAFLRSWVCRFGVPKVVITDNDKTFMSTLFQGIAKRLGISMLRTTVYHPQGNAPIESFHRVLQQGLARLWISGKSDIPFDEALQLVLMGYRLTVHTTTGNTPGFLTYGVDLRPSADTDWRFLRTEAECRRLQYLNHMRLDVQLQAARVIEKQNRSVNAHRTDIEFRLYDLVLTRLTPLERAQLAHNSGGRKLTPQWSTPGRVLRVLMGGKKAIVRNIITGHDKEVHIQDTRSLGLPQGDQQCQEWEEVVGAAELSMYNERDRRRLLDIFWDEVNTPQAILQERKRRRGQVASTSPEGEC
jgi:transposase InsO family protein